MEQPPENSTSCFVNGSNGTSKVQYELWGLSAVTCGICAIVMVLIVCLKAYKTFIDRLVLYVTISTFLLSASIILQTVALMESKVKESVFFGVCSAVGYLSTFTFSMNVLFLLVISLHLFLLVAFRFKVSKYEKLTVVGIPIICAVIATVPFMTKSYGSFDLGCWIKIRENNHSQSIAGFVEQIVFGFAPPIVVASFGLFVAVYVTWVICRERGARRQHMEAAKETIHLVLYPIFNALVNIVLLANSINYYINNQHGQRILSWLTVVLAPFLGLAITLALLFHVILTEHRRRKRKRQMQRTESETRYTVPPEFPSEVEPLFITGARPQEPESAYNTIFLTDSVN